MPTSTIFTEIEECAQDRKYKNHISTFQQIPSEINLQSGLIEANMNLNTVAAICKRVYSNGVNFCHVNDILSPAFWDQMFTEYPRMKNSWGL